MKLTSYDVFLRRPDYPIINRAGNISVATDSPTMQSPYTKLPLALNADTVVIQLSWAQSLPASKKNKNTALMTYQIEQR